MPSEADEESSGQTPGGVGVHVRGGEGLTGAEMVAENWDGTHWSGAGMASTNSQYRVASRLGWGSCPLSRKTTGSQVVTETADCLTLMFSVRLAGHEGAG